MLACRHPELRHDSCRSACKMLPVLCMFAPERSVSQSQSVVFVVDDDASVLAAIERLLKTVGHSVRTFSSPLEFLAQGPVDAPACLVLDMHLPGTSGLDVQRELLSRGQALPIVFISGDGDIPMSVRAMKAGAVEFLAKPFQGQELLAAIEQALIEAVSARQRDAELAVLRRRLSSLTPREKQVMDGVVAGRLNKQIASDLGISEVTVKVHRAQVMHKTGASSVAELVRLSDRVVLKTQ
jgi:FixJ family two-component response regulator